MDKTKIETDGLDGRVPPTRKVRFFAWPVAGLAIAVAFVAGHERAHVPMLSAWTYMPLAAFFLSAVLGAAVWRAILRRQEKMEAGWRRKVKEMADAQRDGAILAAIVTSSDDAIVSKTLDGLITSWNPGAERMFGYTAAEVIGRPVTALFPPELLPEEAGILDRIRKGEIVGHFDTVRCHKGGRRVDVSLTVSPVRDTRGVIVGASKIARDIGERKRATQELERYRLDLEAQVAERTREIATANRMLEGALKEARAANEAKTRFLANMSHEIRTPMNAVLGFIGLVLERETGMETRRQLLMAHKAAKSLLALINDILDLSRLQSGGLTLEPMIFDLRGELRACIDLMREKAREKDISLQFDYADDLPLSHLGDPVRVRQIVTNLLANAIKFTQAGRILLKARPVAHGMVEIAVADTGVGLTAQQAAHVFDRFHQMDDAATRRFSGLGLGVSICKELADLMGGTVGVESEPGVGSTFRARLPLPAASSRMAALSAPSSLCPEVAMRPDAMPYRRFKVLLADDVPENLELAEIYLLAQGHDVTRAHDGREAVDKARQHAFDIILMDVQMPRLSGKAAVRLIREFERETGRHVPVIALSANDCPAERRECLEAGMTAYMTKPLDFDALGALAQQLVPHDGGEPMPAPGLRVGPLARATPQLAQEMTALCQVLESDDPDLIEPVLDRLGPAGLELKALLPLRRLVADFEFAQARALATGMAGAMAGAAAEGGHQGEGARG